MNRRLAVYRLSKIRLNFAQARSFVLTLINLIGWKSFRKLFFKAPPLILMIEPTNRCNFSCPLCDKGTGKLSRPEGSMSPEDQEEILKGAGPGLKMALLWNQGEPFINNKLTKMIGKLRERNVFTIVSTNGSLVSRNAKDIVDSGLDELIISLDGSRRETYDLYRRGGDFDEIVAGVRRLAEVRGDRNKPLISLQFLLLKHNVDEIEDFKRLKEETGADRVLWKTVQVSSRSEADEYLPEDTQYTRYEGRSDLRVKKKGFDCRRIIYSAVIDWNGNLVPCCFDKDENHLIGNVLQQGFSKVWFSREMMKFRQDIAAGNLPEMCHNCTEGLKKLFIN
ncbi:MAG: radical SAM protein [FCB group bacterium]|nr:radical SAM protein [FCB group bacterium]